MSTQQQQQQQSATQQQQTTEQSTKYTSSKPKSRTVQSNVSIKHNFSEEVEDTINDLINVFYFGAYTCRSMEFYFDRDEVALFGMAEFNRCKADHQLNFVRKLEDYQVMRGGEVVLTNIKKPERDEWGTPLESLQYLINMKKLQVDNCLKLHKICEKNDDEHLKEFIECEFLEPLYESIRKCGVMVSNLQRAGTGLGEYEFNKDIELHLSEILHKHKIKHGVSPSVSTQYQQSFPSFPPFSSVPQVHPVAPQIHHEPHLHPLPHQQPITSLLSNLNIQDTLTDVLKKVF